MTWRQHRASRTAPKVRVRSGPCAHGRAPGRKARRGRLDLGAPLELAGGILWSPRAHGAFQKLPVVDVADLSSPEPARRRRAAEALGQATLETGFFYIVGHGVPPALGARLVEQAAAFFALPLERKLALHIGRSANHRGYVPPGEEVFYGGGRDRKEAFDLAL